MTQQHSLTTNLGGSSQGFSQNAIYKMQKFKLRIKKEKSWVWKHTLVILAHKMRQEAGRLSWRPA
jgi:hypothetical protein